MISSFHACLFASHAVPRMPDRVRTRRVTAITHLCTFKNCLTYPFSVDCLWRWCMGNLAWVIWHHHHDNYTAWMTSFIHANVIQMPSIHWNTIRYCIITCCIVTTSVWLLSMQAGSMPSPCPPWYKLVHIVPKACITTTIWYIWCNKYYYQCRYCKACTVM